ncbi:MAG TPA: DUF6457 domain-containing protein [Acidimicrobiales bacterium]|nr:DUF6457 domain-containing protein [Acidimicrobiales bacterium]
MDAAEWLEQLAAALGVAPPGQDDKADLLSLAAVAANASERAAAPISCWLVARAGLMPAEGLALARRLAGESARP